MSESQSRKITNFVFVNRPLIIVSRDLAVNTQMVNTWPYEGKGKRELHLQYFILAECH